MVFKNRKIEYSDKGTEKVLKDFHDHLKKEDCGFAILGRAERGKSDKAMVGILVRHMGKMDLTNHVLNALFDAEVDEEMVMLIAMARATKNGKNMGAILGGVLGLATTLGATTTPKKKPKKPLNE